MTIYTHFMWLCHFSNVPLALFTVLSPQMSVVSDALKQLMKRAQTRQTQRKPFVCVFPKSSGISLLIHCVCSDFHTFLAKRAWRETSRLCLFPSEAAATTTGWLQDVLKSEDVGKKQVFGERKLFFLHQLTFWVSVGGRNETETRREIF